MVLRKYFIRVQRVLTAAEKGMAQTRNITGSSVHRSHATQQCQPCQTSPDSRFHCRWHISGFHVSCHNRCGRPRRYLRTVRWSNRCRESNIITWVWQLRRRRRRGCDSGGPHISRWPSCVSTGDIFTSPTGDPSSSRPSTTMPRLSHDCLLALPL